MLLHRTVPVSVHPRIRHLELDSTFDLMVLFFFGGIALKAGVTSMCVYYYWGKVNGCFKDIGFGSLFRNLVSKLFLKWSINKCPKGTC